nr:reverse transcriptase domain-containing protein [Tanacetum cinerariifolium]
MLRACPHHGFSELTQIDTFYNGLNEQDQDSLNAAASGNLLSKTTRDALKIIENKSKFRYSRCKSNVSRVNTNSRESYSKTDDRIDKLADQISNLVEIVNKQVITPATVKAVEKFWILNEFSNYMKSNESLIRNMQTQINVLWGDFNKQVENLMRNLNNDMRSILGSFFQNQAPTSGTLPSNTIPNLKGKMKAITARSGLAYEGPSIPTNSSPEKVVEGETEETTDKEQPNCQGSTAHIQPPFVPTPIPEPDVPKTQPKPNIPYPSRLNNQKPRESYESNGESLLTNKDKLFELAKVPLNENCSAVLLKKLPKKLGDPGKFLIPCDFPRMDFGIEVDRAKVDVIAKLPHPTTVKGVRIFLGYAGFYRRFIHDFSKIARPMTHLLKKETPFVFSKDCIDAFETLKKKLTKASILVVPDWNLPFELMCDASDFAIGAVLGKQKMKHFQPIHYASKTMTEAQIHYTTT